MKKQEKTFLKNLLAAPGPSSFESRPTRVWTEQAEAYGGSIKQDSYGNTFATFNEGKSPHIMLSGHIDEIGLIVHYIDDDGFLYFKGIGGWDPQQLVGQRVRVLGYKQELLGVIGKKAIHLMKADERKKISTIDDLWIDIGAKDDKDAKQYVRVGDVAVIEQPPVELLNGRFVSKAIDNRIGAYIVLEAARRSSGAKAQVTAAATVQEEIGHMGALVAAYGLEPDIAIAVDVTHATDTPGLQKKHVGDVTLNSGPSLTIGSVVHRGMFNALIETAETKNIPYTIEVSPARTATDADDIAKVRAGVPTAVVSIPNRYMHSPNEMIDLEDLENVIQLITHFIKSLKKTSSFKQP